MVPSVVLCADICCVNGIQMGEAIPVIYCSVLLSFNGFVALPALKFCCFDVCLCLILLQQLRKHLLTSSNLSFCLYDRPLVGLSLRNDTDLTTHSDSLHWIVLLKFVARYQFRLKSYKKRWNNLNENPSASHSFLLYWSECIGLPWKRINCHPIH